jgi:hypothetical protein
MQRITLAAKRYASVVYKAFPGEGTTPPEAKVNGG